MTISLRFFLSKRRVKLRQFCIANNIESYKHLGDVLGGLGVSMPSEDEYKSVLLNSSPKIAKEIKKTSTDKKLKNTDKKPPEQKRKTQRKKRNRQPAKKRTKSSKVAKE